MQVPLCLYQYFVNLFIVTQCVITMVIIKSHMHICGDNSIKCQQWQWSLMSYIFVKNKKKNRFKRRLGFDSIQSSRFKRLLVVMSASHQMMAMSNIVNNSKVAVNNTSKYSYDTDSFPIKIDNCCTQTMSGYQSNFIESTLKSTKVVGFGTTKRKITHIGTIKWDIYNDNGMLHALIIPNAYQVPGCEVRLLSPQHWSQELHDTSPKPDGTTYTTYWDRVKLRRSQQKYLKTIEIDPKLNNVATMWSAGGNV
jgi:hypothetical protein